MNLLESPVPAKLGEISKGTPSVRVADIAFDKQKVGWGEVLRNRTFEHTPTTDPFLHVGGVFFESGMIAHADSRLELKLDGEWSTFSTKFGIQDGRATGSVVFVINGDGKELFRSEITNPKKIGQCNVDIRNITLLELITEGTPDGSDYDWSVWLEPTLHREASSAQSPPPATEQPSGGRSPASSTRSGIDVSSWGPSYGEVVEMIQTMPGGSVSSRIDRDGRSIGSFKIDDGEAVLTDDHLRLLSGLSGIIEVDLGHHTNFSIPGIKQLGRCKGLQSFSVGHYSGINDEFLSVFEGSENLRALKIGGDHITDRGVYSLSKIPQLKKLKLTHCEITDDAIRTLAKLKFLEELRLVACPFGGDGLTAFSGHDQLKVIELRLCKALTADRVMALRHVRSLKEVQLTETTLPASVGEQLRKARSDLLVNHSPVEPAMERMLRKRVPVMDFPGNTPLTEVLDHLVRSFGSFDDKLKFEFAAVGPRGLSLSQSNSEQWNAIDFKLLGGTLGEALERVLESVPNEDLTFSILDNAIVIRRK